ncbi:UNVERIFIED_CONTAM: hypothetical protein Slati_1520300 [Sesamum latifolium]|uniref:Uncharacterized protein n=1 Tax=Sesamum latifolium TaxID=2727402 RepID=A0AAW2X8T7_9LAMI
MQERSKNLCYNCDETYKPGHKCKRKVLYCIISEEEEDAMDSVLQEDSQVNEELEVDMTVSLNAMSGTTDLNTLRVRDVANKRGIHLLIDSGSTHCLPHEDTTVKLGCELEGITPMSVSVDDGSKLNTETWTVSHGTGRGWDWLMKHSLVEFDYHPMRVTVTRKGGERHEEKVVAPRSGHPAAPSITYDHSQAHKELPLHWEIEHQILQKKDAKPKKMPPYRYNYVQKGEIEVIVKGMLDARIVRRSQSPFGSPVLLVKKNDGTWRMFYSAAILVRCLIPRHNEAVPQLLIQWEGSSPAEVTWEDYYGIAAQFPDFLPNPRGQGSQNPRAMLRLWLEKEGKSATVRVQSIRTVRSRARLLIMTTAFCINWGNPV